MTAEEWIGKTIADKYRVEALLGKGGMGLVLHARHVRLDEEVAIKILLAEMLEVQGMKTRFLREARAAAKIKSRHVVRVTDVDEMPDGIPYMVMEYLDGMSLASLRKQKGALAIEDSVRYVLEACDAIAEAHAFGIVHRDLKPANLFLAKGRDGDEMIKVLDFGISKVDAPGDHETTKAGEMMGSPKYMAPEQMLSMHDVDRRCDIWSLGAILFDLTTGRTPFVADTLAKLCAMVINAKPPSPRDFREDLPPGLEAVILRCLQREPQDRFADVAELAAALAPFGPPDMRVPRSRGPLSSGLRITGSSLPAVTTPISNTQKSVDVEKGVDAVTSADVSPGATKTPISPSSAPPSVRSGTVSVWSAPDRGSSRRSPRMVAGGVAAVIGIAIVVFLALHGGDEKQGAQAATAPVPTSEPAQAPSATAQVPSVTPEVPSATAAVNNAVQPPASPSSTGQAAAVPSAERSSAAPAVSASHGTSKPVKKGADQSAPAADPFGGRRR